MVRIALFGGTFDPIHHGHLIQARDALEKLGLSKVIFIPAAISPHKLFAKPASGAARLEMVRAAIAEEPGFEVSDIELIREGPSYAVDTAVAFQTQFPGAELFYLIGQDNLAELHTWREIDRLQSLVRFVVLSRGEIQASAFQTGSSRNFDISATEIRMRVAKGQSIQYLVPDAVRAMIARQNIYQELQP